MNVSIGGIWHKLSNSEGNMNPVVQRPTWREGDEVGKVVVT